MKPLSLERAKGFLAEASKLNPGPWVMHSKYVADAAKNISLEHPGLNPNDAYILGLLHDIGRREGVYHRRHIIDGYRFLAGKDYYDVARICITHSYPIKRIEACFGRNDCLDEENEFLEDFLSTVEYNCYDKLIQLCDTLAMSTGFCLLEKRMVDVALRYGTAEYMIDKWKAIRKIKGEFEGAIGKSIYALLPGVVENTFQNATIQRKRRRLEIAK
jgi:hypothetical protein